MKKSPLSFFLNLIQLVDGKSSHGYFLWGNKNDLYENFNVLVNNGKFLVFKNENTVIDYFVNGVGNSATFTTFPFRNSLKRNPSKYVNPDGRYILDLSLLKRIAEEKDIDPKNGEYLFAIDRVDDILLTFKSTTLFSIMYRPGMELKEVANELIVGKLPTEYYDMHSNFRQRIASQARFFLRFMKARTQFIFG